MGRPKVDLLDNSLYTPFICASISGLCISTFLPKYNKMRIAYQKKPISQVALSQHIRCLVNNGYVKTEDTKKFKRRIYKIIRGKVIKEFFDYFKIYGIKCIEDAIKKLENLNRNISVIQEINLNIGINGTIGRLKGSKKLLVDYTKEIKKKGFDNETETILLTNIYYSLFGYFDYSLHQIFEKIILIIGGKNDFMDMINISKNPGFFNFVMHCDSILDSVNDNQLIGQLIYLTSVIEKEKILWSKPTTPS
ncbi:helix-turn-helix transcriptional regulator [Candidatus Woesearchaeota archaeon]|nr:helix-turn-helix transcriptional regulator [Candidatus Woesearchaeota archaeon]